MAVDLAVEAPALEELQVDPQLPPVELLLPTLPSDLQTIKIEELTITIAQFTVPIFMSQRPTQNPLAPSMLVLSLPPLPFSDLFCSASSSPSSFLRSLRSPTRTPSA